MPSSRNAKKHLPAVTAMRCFLCPANMNIFKIAKKFGLGNTPS